MACVIENPRGKIGGEPWSSAIRAFGISLRLPVGPFRNQVARRERRNGCNCQYDKFGSAIEKSERYQACGQNWRDVNPQSRSKVDQYGERYSNQGKHHQEDERLSEQGNDRA